MSGEVVQDSEWLQKVLPTILSRCQRFDLKPIPAPLIIERLKKIAVEEKITVTEAALACIARMAERCARETAGDVEWVFLNGGFASLPDYGHVVSWEICALDTSFDPDF